MFVYAVYNEVGAYEGEDVLLGLYDNYVDARAFMIDFANCTCDSDEVYIVKLQLGEKANYDFVRNGERV